MGPTSMGPPSSTPPNQQPPMSGPNSHPDGQMPPHPDQMGAGGPPPSGMSGPDNGAGPGHPVTSLITTGPDGATLDEVSQQSTLSNTSAGEFK